jgi:hypothetical protein
VRINVKGRRITISLSENILGRGSEKETIKTFQAYKKYLVQVLSKDKERKEIIVDWQKLEDIIQEADYRHRVAIRQYVHAVLLSLGILKRSRRGAYVFSHEDINPVWGMPGADYVPYEVGTVYFARKEDAIEYGRVGEADSPYDWDISRRVEVVTKKEACRK